LNISESSHFFGETIERFATACGIVLIFLVILRITVSMRPSNTSLIYRGSDRQCMQILGISATIMALYASAFPVMLLVTDAISKKRESTGATGRVATSEHAGFMAWTFLLVMVIFSIFVLLIIMSILITNTFFPRKTKLPDEESGSQANTELLLTQHDSASTSNGIASSSHVPGAGPEPGSVSGSV
jgi:hypothetical protein